MNSQQLIINNQLADLSDDKPVAFTFQVNNLAELKDRQSSYSQAIKLPASATNLSIWGYPNSDAFTQEQPYRLLECKYIVNGVDLVPFGYIELLRYTDFLECQITFGLSGIADILGDKKLSDLDLSAFGDVNDYTFFTIVATQGNTDGYIWPVIDYGYLSTTGNSVSTNLMQPFIFHKDLLNAIINLTGYTWTSPILFNQEYIREMIELVKNGQYYNLPDISLKDFLKDWLQRYFLVPVVDNYKKTVVLRSYDEVYVNKSKAIDWTDKFLDEAQDTSFSFDGYGQSSYFSFKSDKTIFNMNSSRGTIAIDNTTIPLTATMVTSQFAPSDTVVKLDGIAMAEIRKIPDANESVAFSQDTQLRLLLNRQVAVRTLFTDGLLNNEFVDLISVPYFKLDSFQGAGYDEHLARYGYGLKKLLQKTRILTKYLNLSELDVQNFDFFTPVYDAREAKYYMVNLISNYISGYKTKVQLIRL